MTPWGIFLKIASPTTPAETKNTKNGCVLEMFLVLSCVPGQEVLQHTPCNICMIVDLAVYVYIYVKCIYIYLYKRSKPEKNPESASQRLIAAWWWWFPCVNRIITKVTILFERVCKGSKPPALTTNSPETIDWEGQTYTMLEKKYVYTAYIYVPVYTGSCPNTVAVDN